MFAAGVRSLVDRLDPHQPHQSLHPLAVHVIALAAELRMRARDHRQTGGRAHAPDLSRKKSRSIVSCPILACSSVSLVLSSASCRAPTLSPANKAATPSCTTFFQAWTWLACTPYLPESSATVPSSRIAAKATFALNSAPCFLRIFAIANPLVCSHFRGRTLS